MSVNTLMRVRYGLSAERLMTEYELASALGLAIGDVSSNISFRSLDYDKRVALLNVLLKPMHSDDVHQAVQIRETVDDEELIDVYNKNYAGPNQTTLDACEASTAMDWKTREMQKLSEEDLPEHLRQIFEAAKPDNKSDLHKLLRGFPNINDRTFDSPFKDSFTNAMIRDCIMRFMKIIDGGKVSMKVATNIYKHLFQNYIIEHSISNNWNTVRNYEKHNYWQAMTENHHLDWPINASNLSLDDFTKFWSANMCTQEVFFRHNPNSDETLNKLHESGDLALLNLNIDESHWGETYYLPRTLDGIEFMRILSRLKFPLIATSYMMPSLSDEKIDLADMSVRNTSLGSRDAKTISMVSVDDLVSATT